MENNTKEPVLGEYGLTPASYEHYRNEKISLEKELRQYTNKKYYESPLGNIMVIGGILGGLIFQSLTVFIVGLVAGIIVAGIEEERKREENKSKEQELERKLHLLKNKVVLFEDASVIYYQNYLEQFFQSYLYKKRSGGEQFEQSIASFALLIDEVKEISEKLIFKYISTHSYFEYLASRQINDNLQKEKKQIFHSFDSVKFKSGNPYQDSSKIKDEPEDTQDQETPQVVVPKAENEPEAQAQIASSNDTLVSAVSESIKVETVVVPEKKEVPPTIAPEKKYRTARKIDNWEEINRKRKITGTKGEEIALAIEQEYFESIGRKDLADRVRHVSVEDGDGLGYDILSFFDNGKEKYIEVKSTTVSIGSPFNISSNELGFLREHMDDSFVCRVLVSNEALDEVPQYEMVPSYVVLDHDIIPTVFVVRPRKTKNHGTPQRSVWERIFVD